MNERPRWLTLALVILSVLALLAFAACGGGDDDDDDDTTATATQDAGDDGGDDGGDDDGDDTDPTDAPDDGDDDDGDDPFGNLDEITEGLDQVTGQISYEVNTDGEVTTMTLYSDPPNSRYDFGDSDGISSIIIYTEENTYTCAPDSETCFAQPSDGTGGLGGLGFLSGFFGSGAVSTYVALAEIGGYDVDTSSEEHAGIDTECFAWADPSDEEAAVKFCFSDSGVMLYEEIGSSDSSTTITATEYSEDVDDGAFEPPYDVTDLDF